MSQCLIALSFLVCYPISFYALPPYLIQKFIFPQRGSFVYLVIFLIQNSVQDIILNKVVKEQVEEDVMYIYSNVGVGLKMRYFETQTLFWIIMTVVQSGWFFQHIGIGAFKE